MESLPDEAKGFMLCSNHGVKLFNAFGASLCLDVGELRCRSSVMRIY